MLRVQDHLVGPRLPGQLGFFLGRDGADDARPAQPRDLAQQLPHAARRRVHEAGVACLERVGRRREVVSRHPLEHRRGGLLGADAVGEHDQPIGGDGRVFRVSAEHGGVRDAMPDLQPADPRTHRGHGATRFLAQNEGRRHPVLPAALVDVDEVDPGRVDLDERLSRGGRGLRHVQIFEGVWTAGRADLDGFHDDKLR